MDSAQREELVAALENSRTNMEGLLDKAGEDRLAQPGVTGEWSIKDILAHVTAWEERILAWAEALHQRTRPRPAPWPSGLSEEQVNAFIFEHNRARSLQEVLEHWRHVHQEIIYTVQSLSEEDLFGHKVDWLNGSFADSVPGNSYEHLDQHANEIRSWIEAK